MHNFLTAANQTTDLRIETSSKIIKHRDFCSVDEQYSVFNKEK